MTFSLSVGLLALKQSVNWTCTEFFGPLVDTVLCARKLGDHSLSSLTDHPLELLGSVQSVPGESVEVD